MAAKIHLDPWTDIVGVGWNGIRYLVATYRMYSAHVLHNGNTMYYDGWPQLEMGYLPPPYPGGWIGDLDPSSWTSYWISQHGVGYYNNGFHWNRFSASPPASVTTTTLQKYGASGASLGTQTLTLNNLPTGILNTPGSKTYAGQSTSARWVAPFSSGTIHPRATWQYQARPWRSVTTRAVEWQMLPITSSPSTVYQIASGGPGVDLGGRIGLVGSPETFTRTLDFSAVTVTTTIGGTPRTFRCTGSIVPQADGYSTVGPFTFSDPVTSPVVSVTQPEFLTVCIAYLLLEREDFIP
jgi:hypothetical protein